jgi:NAD-dependent SIR2 family protein deacetylase
MKNKTVYVLGAGASKTANLPIQNELLSLVFSINLGCLNINPKNKRFIEIDFNKSFEQLSSAYYFFDEDRAAVGEFLLQNYSSPNALSEYQHIMNLIQDIKKTYNEENKAEKGKYELMAEELRTQAYDKVKNINVNLEDVFTVFDNISSGKDYFRLYKFERMAEIEQQFRKIIIYAIVYAMNRKECNDSTYQKFAEYLCGSILKRNSCSVLTMNWDTLLEKTINNSCTSYNASIKPSEKHIYPDLCFYDYLLERNRKYIPSTLIKAKGKYNIKILKLHGSVNWLECPKCKRVFRDFDDDIAINEFDNIVCPYCIINDNDGPKLRNFIITPTFMKSLNNLHLRNIWNNAFLDLTEATELVFIGYSFPKADFELRCLLKKAIGTDTKITVVLHGRDTIKYYRNLLKKRGIPEDEINRVVSRMDFPEERYKSFFGSNQLKFDYSGFEGYVKKQMEVEDD